MAELERRVESLEGQIQHVVSVLDHLATRQVELDNALEILADSHIKTQEQFRETDAKFRETDARFRETDARFRETDARFNDIAARFRETDTRIDRLVSSIGEFIRVMSERKN
jgi:chromosome segregation ATPase